MGKDIFAIDARVGKRGKRETVRFAGSMAAEEIAAYKKEMQMTKADMEASKESASDSASAAATSAEEAAVSDKSAKAYAGSAKTSASSAAESATTAETNANKTTADMNTTNGYMESALASKNAAASAAADSATKAELSESWAVGGTGKRDGEDTNNSKYWAEQAAENASKAGESVAGVSTFNGRSGAVMPQSGDYSYDMITGTPPAATYDTATSSSDGLMSKTDKAKLDGIAAGATKTTVDSALSSTSTNPVQNKAVNTAITSLKAVVTTSANGLMSASDKTKLNGIATGAQVNQNAFSTIAVGSASVAADSTTDTLTLAGSNVTLTPDTTNDKITIGITKANVTDALGYTPPESDTTYEAATTSAAGLMSSSDKSKLDGIAEGANKTVVDSQWSSTSTNPIQNKILNAAIAGLKAVATTSANGLMSAADKTKLDGIEESATKVKRLATKALTASGGTLTWTDSEIGDTSLIDVYATIPNIAPSEISQSGTTVTVTFDSQDSAFNVCITVQN